MTARRPRAAAVQAAVLAVSVSVCLLPPPPARGAELAVTIEPPSATVGDRVVAELLLSAAPGELDGEPRFPAWDGRWGGTEIVETGPVERLEDGAGGDARFRQRLVLAAFRTGSLELPPKQVAVPGPAATAELWTPADLALEIESVLPPEPDAGALEPRPPAPPAPLPLGGAFWWTLAALVALAGALLVPALRRRVAPGAADRPHTPEEELESALAAARSAPAAEEGHVVLSLGLRRFLGRRFGFPAAESTTGEIRRQLRSRRCPPTLEGRIHEVLQGCDRVKFAREPVALPALEARVEAAREIAREVDEHFRPPASEDAGQDGPRREVAA